MAYSEQVIDHYNNPRNVGTLDKASSEVGTGLVGAPECGDVMRLQIRVNPETQVIEEGNRMDQGPHGRRRNGHQEHRYREGAFASSGQDSLLGAGRGRNPRRHRRLEEEERRCRSCDRNGQRSALELCGEQQENGCPMSLAFGDMGEQQPKTRNLGFMIWMEAANVRAVGAMLFSPVLQRGDQRGELSRVIAPSPVGTARLCRGST